MSEDTSKSRRVANRLSGGEALGAAPFASGFIKGAVFDFTAALP
jgi:hypothetical protein